jgi:tRNA nucleotidyltransferase (CCA-adding enzyme)
MDALFLVVQSGEKTHVIGRSRIPQVNAGAVLEPLGGGGHLTAASAAVRDLTYLETCERLIDILKHHIRPGKMAADIMTAPVKTTTMAATIEQASEDMTRFSVNVLPVLAGPRFLGIITREVVQKEPEGDRVHVDGDTGRGTGYAAGPRRADHDRGAPAVHAGHRP